MKNQIKKLAKRANKSIRLAVCAAMLPTAWALCSSYHADKIADNYRRDNAFIELTKLIRQDRPELWQKIEASEAYTDFCCAYDNGDADQQANALMFLVDYEDPTYVADCLTGTDAWHKWQELR